MTDKEIKELWTKLQGAKNYTEIHAILKEAFKKEGQKSNG